MRNINEKTIFQEAAANQDWEIIFTPVSEGETGFDVLFADFDREVNPIAHLGLAGGIAHEHRFIIFYNNAFAGVKFTTGREEIKTQPIVGAHGNIARPDGRTFCTSINLRGHIFNPVEIDEGAIADNFEFSRAHAFIIAQMT